MAELNYEKLLADKKLEIGVAIGYEFNAEFATMVNFLKSAGFTLNARHTKFYDIYSRKKMYQKKKTKADPNPASVEILIEISIMYSGKDNPKSTFSDFLANKEVVLYSGHARAGHGPDFDGDDVTTQNFVIGDNSFYHRSRVLPRTPFYNHAQIPKNQQNYLDEVRGVWKKNMFQGSLVRDEKGNRISSDNLLFFGTRHSIYTDALPLLKELIEFHTMDQIINKMSESEKNIRKGNTDPKERVFQNDTFFSN
jgi:hypothetical protein